jgi:hypothetical protein
MAEEFAQVGVHNVPVGIEGLTRKQRIFCLEFLRTGIPTEAARRAGYSSPESDGSKVQRNDRVRAFLARAGNALTEETTQLVLRNEERSRALHTLLARECAQEHPRTAEIAKLTMAVTRVDTLLAVLKGVKGASASVVSGNITHTHEHQGEVTVTIPATALPVLAQMRRDATEAGLTAPERN